MPHDPKYGDEPSMAEILASVRRIVAEDRPEKLTEEAQVEISAEPAVETVTDTLAEISPEVPVEAEITALEPAPLETAPPESLPASEGKKASILQQLLARQAAPVSAETEVDVLELVNPVSKGNVVAEAPEVTEVATPDDVQTDATPEAPTAEVSDERLVAAFELWSKGPGEEQLRRLVREELRSTLGAALARD